MPSEDGSDTEEQQGATWEHQSLAQVEYINNKNHDGMKLLTALTNDWTRNSAKAMIVSRDKL